MTATIIDFDARRVAPYVIKSIESFLTDPPDSEHQLGFLSAMVAVYQEGLGKGEKDARVIAAERILGRR